MRNPFHALKDPAKRTRAIIWLFVAVIAIGALYATSMVVTSTTWFCNDVCHNVHADNKKTYYAGVHSKVSCMACHYPPSLDPVRFALDRVDKLLDVYPTLAGTFEMPLNEYSRIALRTSSDTCTQCHSSNRAPTPARGILIGHEAHAGSDISCTVCHNRVAHPEKSAYTLPGNRHHEDFMTMRACFRCHGEAATVASDLKASGECATCHTESFDLTPASHRSAGGAWLTAPAGGASMHAAAANADAKEVEEATAEWNATSEHFLTKPARPIMRLIGVDTEPPLDLPPAATVSECYSCHARTTFCDPCHTRSGVAVTE